MKLDLKKILTDTLQPVEFSKEQLFYKVLPHFILEIMTKYFRLEVIGAENIPRKGPALITPNHSGFTGFDAVLLAHHIQQKTQRIPRVLTHNLWFINKNLSIPMKKMGFIEATTENGIKFLKKKQIVALFPEGENGNFKPTRRAYKLQEFKRGYIRMALTTGAPIVPCLIIGAEESNINLAKIKLSKHLRGLVLPLPLNTLPLPAKWKLIFLPPIYLPYKPSEANNSGLVHELNEDIREKMQTHLSNIIKKRKSLF